MCSGEGPLECRLDALPKIVAVDLQPMAPIEGVTQLQVGSSSMRSALSCSSTDQRQAAYDPAERGGEVQRGLPAAGRHHNCQDRCCCHCAL